MITLTIDEQKINKDLLYHLLNLEDPRQFYAENGIRDGGIAIRRGGITTRMSIDSLSAAITGLKVLYVCRNSTESERVLNSVMEGFLNQLGIRYRVNDGEITFMHNEGSIYVGSEPVLGTKIMGRRFDLKLYDL